MIVEVLWILIILIDFSTSFRRVESCRHTERQRDRQSGRRSGGQTGRQTDRQTDKQRTSTLQYDLVSHIDSQTADALLLLLPVSPAAIALRASLDTSLR
jgi:hypothetical protein